MAVDIKLLVLLLATVNRNDIKTKKQEGRKITDKKASWFGMVHKTSRNKL